MSDDEDINQGKVNQIKLLQIKNRNLNYSVKIIKAFKFIV